MIPSWILTFKRPAALNRQIDSFKSWTEVNIFTNHPDIELTEEKNKLYESKEIKVLFNTLSDPDATAYCARSWNSIFLKVFKDHDEAILVQDDTLITNPDLLKNIIEQHKEKYDLIWGPAGDQFFYMKKSVLQKVGFFDERFCTGCFCGDADFLKRCWRVLDKDRISVVEMHDWGFVHNDVGLSRVIPTDIRSKMADSNYVNQYHAIESMDPQLACLHQAQAWWIEKWGHALNGTGSMIQHINPPRVPELHLYPWFVKKYLGIDGLPSWCKKEEV